MFTFFKVESSFVKNGFWAGTSVYFYQLFYCVAWIVESSFVKDGLGGGMTG